MILYCTLHTAFLLLILAATTEEAIIVVLIANCQPHWMQQAEKHSERGQRTQEISHLYKGAECKEVWHASCGASMLHLVVLELLVKTNVADVNQIIILFLLRETTMILS